MVIPNILHKAIHLHQQDKAIHNTHHDHPVDTCLLHPDHKDHHHLISMEDMVINPLLNRINYCKLTYSFKKYKCFTLRNISCKILFLLKQFYMVLSLNGNINLIIQYNIKNFLKICFID